MNEAAGLTSRLAEHYDPSSIDPGRHAAWLIGTVLEDGDSTQVSRLVELVGVEPLRRWLAERGGRQLSGRSLALWALSFDVEVAPERAGEELWPR